MQRPYCEVGIPVENDSNTVLLKSHDCFLHSKIVMLSLSLSVISIDDKLIAVMDGGILWIVITIIFLIQSV